MKIDSKKQEKEQIMNKAIIFDWAGTLNDSFSSFCKVTDLMFNELGEEPISADEIRLNFTAQYMKFWNKYFPDLAKEKQDEMYLKYYTQMPLSEVYPGVVEVLKSLHEDGWMLFVVSSDPVERLIGEIEKSGCEHLFTKVFGDVYKKNEVITPLIHDYKLDKNSTYYVGDMTGDIEAGRLSKVKTVGITWGFQHEIVLKASNPDFIINNIKELMDVI